MKKITALILSLVMCTGVFFSCSDSKKEVAFKAKGGGEASINLVYLMTAMYKSMYSSIVDGYGYSWDEPVSENGTTYSELLMSEVITTVQDFLVCEYLHDEVYGLSLTKEQKRSAEKQIDKYVDYCGSEEKLNDALSEYSADKETLERYAELSLKHNNLYKHFYGDDGIYRISEEDAKQYFADNYAVVTHIYFSTSPVEKADGSKVSMSAEEVAAKRETAQLVYNSLTAGEDFYALKAQYTEDLAEEQYYPNGFLVTNDSSFPTDFTLAALEMNEGEYRLVESSSGIHVMYKLPMNAELYNTDENIYSSIMSRLISADFTSRLDSYIYNDDGTLSTEVLEITSEQMEKVKSINVANIKAYSLYIE